MSKNENIIIGLDLGSTKVCSVVGKVNANEELEIIGVGTSVSEGIVGGVVVDINLAVQSIKASIDEAKIMSGCDLSNVFVGITDKNVASQIETVIQLISSGKVDKKTLSSIEKQAANEEKDPKKRVLHILPEEYIIDGQGYIKNPLGMSCNKLTAKFNVITVNSSTVNNIESCLSMAGLGSANMPVLAPYAAGFCLLNKEEKELGVMVLDIGGATSDVSVFLKDKIKNPLIYPIAGKIITEDIAKCLSITIEEAERIKTNYGHAISKRIDRDEMINVFFPGDIKHREINRARLCEIIQSRLEEILKEIKKLVLKRGLLEYANSGIIITGGTSLLPGINELTKIIFDMPVRTGIPKNFKGLTSTLSAPIYSTAIGLTIYGYKYMYGDVILPKKRTFNRLGIINKWMTYFYNDFGA